MSGRYNAYPEYRDSGVEWLGEVPPTWTARRLKHNLISPMQYGANESALDEDKNAPRFIRITDIDQKGNLRDDTYKSLPKHIAKPYLLEDGDVLLARTGATVGKSFIYRKEMGECCFAGYLIKASVDTSKILPDIFNYYTQTKYYKNWIDSIQVQATLQNVSAEKYNEFYCVFPSIQEQQKIASFLDHETAKIDTLIEKQEKLIALLEEKRQAVISHAVTKGLDPNAKMKNSGIEWLGEIPHNWSVNRVASIFEERVQSGSTVLPVLSVSIHHGISDKELSSEDAERKMTRIEDRSKYKRVYKNDIAYNMMRAWQGAFGASKTDGQVSPAYVVAKPKDQKINSTYFERVFRTNNCIKELKKYSRGITDFRLRLYWDEFRTICLPVPPINEINEILKHLNCQESKISNIIKKSKENIQILKERKTSLISSAVTGKIDLRSWDKTTA